MNVTQGENQKAKRSEEPEEKRQKMLRLDAMLQTGLKLRFEMCFDLAVEEGNNVGGQRQILVVPPPDCAGAVPEAFPATNCHSTFTYDV